MLRQRRGDRELHAQQVRYSSIWSEIALAGQYCTRFRGQDPASPHALAGLRRRRSRGNLTWPHTTQHCSLICRPKLPRAKTLSSTPCLASWSVPRKAVPRLNMGRRSIRQLRRIGRKPKPLPSDCWSARAIFAYSLTLLWPACTWPACPALPKCSTRSDGSWSTVGSTSIRSLIRRTTMMPPCAPTPCSGCRTRRACYAPCGISPWRVRRHAAP